MKGIADVAPIHPPKTTTTWHTAHVSTEDLTNGWRGTVSHVSARRRGRSLALPAACGLRRLKKRERRGRPRFFRACSTVCVFNREGGEQVLFMNEWVSMVLSLSKSERVREVLGRYQWHAGIDGKRRRWGKGNPLRTEGWVEEEWEWHSWSDLVGWIWASEWAIELSRWAQ